MSYSYFRRQKPAGTSVYICLIKGNPRNESSMDSFYYYLLRNRPWNTCRSMTVLIFQSDYEDSLINTCSFAVAFLWVSSAGLQSCGLWALRIKLWDRAPRRTPSFVIQALVSPGLWAVLFLTSGGRRDAVARMNSHGRVLGVTSRAAVGLESGLLLCNSGSMRRCQSDEEGRHHPLLWSCRCHGCIRPTTLIKRTQLLLSAVRTVWCDSGKCATYIQIPLLL